MDRRRLVPPLVGVLLLLLFFASLLDPSVQLYYRDTGRLYYPVKLYIAQQLRAGHLPLWDTMTEAGASLLGQVTPALLHPATLLYLALPFDLAFKLNHLLGPLLGGVGAWLLARRLGASPWARLLAAIGYGGCGYLVSVTGSNLPYSLGAGTVPLAVDAVLGFVESPRVGRLAWGAAAVALLFLGGDPQSVWIAGLLSAAWALALGLSSVRLAARNVALAGACGALALCLAAPAVLPAMAELRRSDRASGINAKDRGAFYNHPYRLAGLLVPRAFDDSTESVDDPTRSTLSEYFDGPAFADSIVLGAPLLLLAFAAGFASRRGRVLLAGAVLFTLASTGDSLGLERVILGAIPLENLFRYAEKLIAPASLLFALAASLGADFALGESRRASAWLAACAGAVAALAALGALSVGDRLVAAMESFGKSHAPMFAEAFCRELRAGLFDAAGLAAALGFVALWRWLRQRESRLLAALCCAGSVFASSGGLLYRCPIEYVRGPFDLAERMKAQAGPSPGRWRLFVNNEYDPAMLRGFPGRLAAAVSSAEALLPQYNATAGIEGITNYFSAGDPAYGRAIHENPEKYFDVFGVRYVVEMPGALSERFARSHGFARMGLGYWVRQYPVRSRAFVVGRAERADGIEQGVAAISAPGFDLRARAVMRGAGAPAAVEGRIGGAILERPSPERIVVRATGPGLLVIGEHFDPGWRASIAGRDAPVLEADLAALGVVLPGGPCVVELHFLPRGFTVGLLISIAAALALAAAAARRR